MDGSIGSQQVGVAQKVVMNGITIISGAATILASGGALTPAVLAASAEIFFAGTDTAITLYKTELQQAVGEDIVKTLELANTIHGIATLGVKITSLPDKLVTLRTKAGTLIDYGKGISLKAGDIVTEVAVDAKKFFNSLPAILEELKNHPTVKAQLFDRISDMESSLKLKIAGFTTSVSSNFQELYTTTKKIATKFYVENMPPALGAVIDNLPSDKLQVQIVNRLLQYSFEGKKFLEMDVKGVLNNIKLYKNPDNYTTIVGNFRAKVALKSGKTYTESIEVVKNHRGEPLFRPKFDEGFVREGELINEIHVRSGNGPPYMDGTRATDIVIQPGQRFYMAEYLDRSKQSAPGGFASNSPISSIKELREELAVLEAWKDPAVNDLVLREYEVLKPIKARTGTIGPQTEVVGTNTGVVYPGGGHQYEFIDNWRSIDWTTYMVEIGSPVKLKP